MKHSKQDLVFQKSFDSLFKGSTPPLSTAYAQGFMFGIAIIPSVVPPHEWRDALLGKTEVESPLYTKLFLSLINLYNENFAALHNGRLHLPFRFNEDTSLETVEEKEWLNGFVQAISLRPLSWRQHEEAYIRYQMIRGVVDPAGLIAFFKELPKEASEGFPMEGEDACEKMAAFCLSYLDGNIASLCNYTCLLRKKGKRQTTQRNEIKTGRNDDCPCGSGKKYKKCCLKKPAGNTSENLIINPQDFVENSSDTDATIENSSETVTQDTTRQEEQITTSPASKPIERAPSPTSDMQEPEGLEDKVQVSSYQLRIDIKRAKPPLWRRVNLPSTVSLTELHRIIYTAIGWKDDAEYRFVFDGQSYDTWAAMAESRSLADILDGERSKFSYTYGDEWDIQCQVEKVLETACNTIEITAGRRACPPAECGNIKHYQEALSKIANGDLQDTALTKLVNAQYSESFSKKDMDAINKTLSSL